MTESEWQIWRDSGRLSERKVRLFAVACCRHIWDLLTDEASREAVLVAERHADGLATDEQRRAALLSAMIPNWANVAAQTSAMEAHFLPLRTARYAVYAAEETKKDHSAEIQRLIARDIFGPSPFHLFPSIVPEVLAWNNGTVVRLAQAAYDDRLLPSGHLRPQRLAILCDALLDAGCTLAEELLQHLQGNGPHWRGCRAVDAILGKS